MWGSQLILLKESKLPVTSLAVPVYIVEENLQNQKQIFILTVTNYVNIYNRRFWADC